MRSAYCIMAHEQLAILQEQLKLLDDERNDIYIHIDRKTQGVDMTALRACCPLSRVVFLPRGDVRWGEYGVVNCELALLREACKIPHDLIHMLSGADLPLCSQAFMHDFFDAHPETEFVSIIDDWADTPSVRERFTKYHWFFKPAGRDYSGFWGFVERASMAFQRRVPMIDRSRAQAVRFYGGSNWFSITPAFAAFVLSQEDWIARTFRYTICADEIFLQTILMNSPFSQRRYQPPKSDRDPSDNAACLRKIDWQRGSPYTWRAEDIPELLSSGMLFARKFSLASPEETSAVRSLVQAVSAAHTPSSDQALHTLSESGDGHEAY